MKKISTIILTSLFFAVVLFAQTETLFYGNTATILENPYGGGYIAGTNEYGDLGKYQLFDFVEKVNLKKIKYFFAVAKTVDSPDTVKLVVRSVGDDGAPADLLKVINTTTDKLDVTQTGNEFVLDQDLVIDGSAFIGFEISPAFNDTLAIFTDKDGEGDNANRAWELFSDGSYNDFGTLLNEGYSWGIDVDLWIAAEYSSYVELTEMFLGNTPTLLKNPYGPGFIAGTNGYGDIGKYQKFDFYDEVALQEIKYYFGYKDIVGQPDTICLVVRGENATDGTPGELLATVKTTTDVLDTTKVGNKFTLPSPIVVNGNIFVGFEFVENSDDTLAIFTDQDGEGDGAGGRAWELFSDGSYNDFGTSLFSDYSWGIDVDLWISIYYNEDATVGVEKISDEIPSSFALSQNYPNPFNPNTRINYTISESSSVKLTVHNVIGEVVDVIVNEKQSPGEYVVDWKASGYASGIYFYTIDAVSENNEIFRKTKKMILIK